MYLFTSIFLSILSINIVAFRNMFYFGVFTEFDNFMIAEDILHDSIATSSSECASICVRSLFCLSFAHNNNTHQCVGYSVFRRTSLPGSSVSSQGWSHYFILGKKPIVINNKYNTKGYLLYNISLFYTYVSFSKCLIK